MTITKIELNELLNFVYPTAPKANSCPLLWDLRNHPSTSAEVNSRTQKYISKSDSRTPHSQFATSPPVTALRITCDIFPYRWRITARNKQGVTVRDVLEAIYDIGQVPLNHLEWDGLSYKQKERVKLAYDLRWRSAAFPEGQRKEGVRRIDCLLHYTRFAGLSMSFDRDFGCILTLSRNLTYRRPSVRDPSHITF